MHGIGVGQISSICQYIVIYYMPVAFDALLLCVLLLLLLLLLLPCESVWAKIELFTFTTSRLCLYTHITIHTHSNVQFAIRLQSASRERARIRLVRPTLTTYVPSTDWGKIHWHNVKLKGEHIFLFVRYQIMPKPPLSYSSPGRFSPLRLLCYVFQFISLITLNCNNMRVTWA